MARLLRASTSSPSMTFAGSFNFIDDQELFDITFGSNPPPLHLTTSQHGAKENLVVLSGRINNFVSMCQIFIFCSHVEKQYVGTDNYNSCAIMSNEEAAFSQLKMKYLSRTGKQHCRTLDDIFRKCI